MLLLDPTERHIMFLRILRFRRHIVGSIAVAALGLGFGASAERGDLNDSQELEFPPQKNDAASLGAYINNAKDSLKNNKPEHNALLGATLGGLLTANPAGVFLGGAVAGAMTDREQDQKDEEQTGIYGDITPPEYKMPEAKKRNDMNMKAAADEAGPSNDGQTDLALDIQVEPTRITEKNTENNPVNMAPEMPEFASSEQSIHEPPISETSIADPAIAKLSNSKASHSESQKPQIARPISEKPEPRQLTLATATAAKMDAQPDAVTQAKLEPPPLPSSCFDRSDNNKRERPNHCYYMLY